MAHTDLNAALRHIARKRAEIINARSDAEGILQSVEKQLIGKRYEPTKLGNLKGVYEIAWVYLLYDGRISAYGRKVLTSGQLGDRVWDLGTVGVGTEWVT